jgi:hypothetical protein
VTREETIPRTAVSQLLENKALSRVLAALHKKPLLDGIFRPEWIWMISKNDQKKARQSHFGQKKPWGDKDQSADLTVVMEKINSDLLLLGKTLGFWRG